MNCSTLVPDDQRGLVGVETHAADWGIDLEQSLTLLGTTSEGGRGEDGEENNRH